MDVHQAGASALSPKIVLHSQRPRQKYYPAVEVTEDDKKVMDDVHLMHLRSEFGV